FGTTFSFLLIPTFTTYNTPFSPTTNNPSSLSNAQIAVTPLQNFSSLLTSSTFPSPTSTRYNASFVTTYTQSLCSHNNRIFHSPLVLYSLCSPSRVKINNFSLLSNTRFDFANPIKLIPENACFSLMMYFSRRCKSMQKRVPSVSKR